VREIVRGRERRAQDRFGFVGGGEEREGDGEGGTLAGLAFDGDSTVVGFDNGFANAEAEAGAPGDAVAAAGAVGAEKPIKDLGLVVFRDADSIVADSQAGALSFIVA
jgi:hypothetical protein